MEAQTKKEMTPLTPQEILEHQIAQAFGKFQSWTDYFKENNLMLVKIEDNGTPTIYHSKN